MLSVELLEWLKIILDENFKNMPARKNYEKLDIPVFDEKLIVIGMLRWRRIGRD